MLPRLAGADVVWLCAPNNPTGAAEPLAVIEAVLRRGSGLGSQGARRRRRRGVCRVLARDVRLARRPLPGARRRAHGVQGVRPAGMRVGYAVAQRPTIERLERLRPPGQRLDRLRGGRGGRAPATRAGRRPTPPTSAAERDWLAGAAGRHRAAGLSERHQLPAGAGRGPWMPPRSLTEVLLRRGIVTRTFGPANPLRGHLRFTVRDPRGERAAAGRAPDAGRPGGQHDHEHGAPRSGSATTRETTIRGQRRPRRHRAAASIATGVGFYDHLLTSFAHHSLIDLEVAATGDLAGRRAPHRRGRGARPGRRHLGGARRPGRHHPLRGRRGAHGRRARDACALDLSGRPYAVLDLAFRGERVGALSTQLVEHILESFARTLGANLHVRASGRNDHHIAEAAFKALARVAARGRGHRPAARRRGLHQGLARMSGRGLVIVDYGAGNLVSIRNALELLGGAPAIASDAGGHRRRVGHRGARRRRQRPGDGAAAIAGPGRPHPGGASTSGAWYVGICLGLQLLFERSDEDGARMLGLLAGRRRGHRGRAPPAAHRLEPAGGAAAAPAPRGCRRRRAGLLRAQLSSPGRRTPSIVVTETEHGSRFPSIIVVRPHHRLPAPPGALRQTTGCGCCATCWP